MSPFGKVRFKDFFFADILTSITTPLADMGFIYVYFADAGYKNTGFKKIDPKDYPNLKVYLILIAFAPFWWRFWQCINKWYTSNNRWQLVNALKYLSRFGPIIAVIYGA